jgi:hypothetical protein
MARDAFLDVGEFFGSDAGKEIADTVPEEECHGVPDAGSDFFLDVLVLRFGPGDGALEPGDFGVFLVQFRLEVSGGRQGVVQFDGADFVHEAHADLAAHGGVSGAVGAFHFFYYELLNGAASQDLAGAGEIEGAGLVQAIQEIDVHNAGEEGALSGGGEMSFCLSLNRR